MHPTKERNLFSVLVRYKSENILIDCGEGTQRQMRIIGLKTPKISRIFLTHLHGDHINGLPGLIQNLQANQYSKGLDIYGPTGTRELMKHILEITRFRIKINVHEIVSGVVYKDEDFHVEAIELKHSIKVYGYSIIENDKRRINLDYLKKFNLKKHILLGDLQKGKDIVYEGKKIKAKDATILVKGKKLTLITDTVYCDNCVKLSKDADLLVSECTYSDKLKDLAKERKHLTAVDAATIAKKAKVKKLIITHFSQRYNDISILLKEANKVFKNTYVAKDFMKIKI